MPRRQNFWQGQHEDRSGRFLLYCHARGHHGRGWQSGRPGCSGASRWIDRLGECEASPLVSIAAFVTPMSHGACQPVSASVLGQILEKPSDIAEIASQVAYRSMDLLQAAHTWSGIEMALWDLLGKARGEPAWKLLAMKEPIQSFPMPRHFSARPRRKPLNVPVQSGPRGSGLRSSVGLPLAIHSRGSCPGRRGP